MFAKTLIVAAVAGLVAAAPVTERATKNVASFYDLDSHSENDGWANAVACDSGSYHNDSPIAAVKGGQNNCGKEIQVTNTGNGKSIKVTVMDECASCDEGQVDLPIDQWLLLGESEDMGLIPIEWHYL